MTVGTRSCLWGYHALWLHGWTVAAAWWKLYGFPKDIRLWFAFFLHDIGYVGRDSMDGPDGKLHPKLGADILSHLFDSKDDHTWFRFSYYHSRSTAKTYSQPFSQLCVADKLAITYYPTWFFLLLTRLSGELTEYVAMDKAKYGRDTDRAYVDALKERTKKWVAENRDKYDR